MVLIVSSDHNIWGETNSRRILLNINRSSLEDTLSLEVLVNHEYVHYCLEGLKKSAQVIPGGFMRDLHNLCHKTSLRDVYYP